MKDPFNPTIAELEEWARTVDAVEPTQDWDLMVTDAEKIQTVFSLAAAPNLPNWRYFLHCLYLFVGDAARTNFRVYSRSLVEELLGRVNEHSPKYLHRWQERSQNLISGTERFDYELWCGGGYARQEHGNAG
jgi:hypothetical protein